MEKNWELALLIWTCVALLAALLFFNLKLQGRNHGIPRAITFYSACGVTGVAIVAFVKLTTLTF